jgi:hypothetical protein
LGLRGSVAKGDQGVRDTVQRSRRDTVNGLIRVRDIRKSAGQLCAQVLELGLPPRPDGDQRQTPWIWHADGVKIPHCFVDPIAWDFAPGRELPLRSSVEPPEVAGYSRSVAVLTTKV